MGRLDGHVAIRFPANLAAAAKQRAIADGMDVSAWIRLMVDREIARREGRCQCCGQPVPHTPAETVPDLEG